MITRKECVALARATRDAYSADRYASWSAVATMLLRRGYTAREAEAILRSKWTRWAADSAKRVPATSADLARYLDGFPEGALASYVAELVWETFGESPDVDPIEGERFDAIAAELGDRDFNLDEAEDE